MSEWHDNSKGPMHLFPIVLPDAWPLLPTKGDAMNIGGRLPRWGVLLILVVLGIGFIACSHYFALGWDHGVIAGIGEALLVAAVLSFTIERWFRQDFARDVFYGALGAILRPEFRDELRWITSFRWLATKSNCKIKIEDLGNQVVRITLTLNREIENISSFPEKFKGYLGIDDWGISGYTPNIEQCSIKVGTSTVEATKMERTPTHLSATTAKAVTVPPGEKVRAYSRSVEYKRVNDIYVLALTNPTKDPEVELEISETLAAEVSFTSRGQMDTEPFSGKRTLNGTYLPGQLMIVRWWPKEPSSSPPTELAGRTRARG